MKATEIDYYALLGVDAIANDAALRNAWRRLAAQWHPDRAGAGATQKFQQLSAAYEVLCDPVKRAAYDRRRRMATPNVTTTVAHPPGDAARSARKATPAVMLSRVTGALPTLLACGVAHLEEEGFITLMLRKSEAEQGGMVRVSMQVDLWCPECGRAGGSTPSACARCAGKRTVSELFSAWLAVPPGAADGEVLTPSAVLVDMIDPVRFRVRVGRKPA
jgi:molecular chaperone DnaJ